MKYLATNHKFIFIGGLHRSGKSLIYKCLKEHPLISGFNENTVHEDEGQHVQSVYKPAKFYDGQGRFGFKSEAHLTEASPLLSDENKQRLFSEWKRYWDMEKPFLMEQSPPNLIISRFLQEIFPDSYFIMITRHPVPVSYETQKCRADRHHTLYSLVKHWLVSHETFEGDREYLRNGLVVKYEDFVQSPNQCIEGVYSFLGLDKHNISEKIRPDINNEYFEKWNESRANIFMKSYVGIIKKRFETRVRQFGYSLYDLK